MQRVHRKRHQVYQEKDFEIQSLNSLIRQAKQRTTETIQADVQLPLHGLAERLTENLQQMHHHLQKLLSQKLGPDARHVIAAERARQSQAEKARLGKDHPEWHHHHHPHHAIAEHLSEIGLNIGDELELLNEYRERYADILANLLVVKERLVELEKGLKEQVDGPLKRQLAEEISELGG
jgi:hypothetical protein